MRLLIDGTKLYFAIKKGGNRLDYNRLARLTNKERYYYTSFNPANEKQESFLRTLRSIGFNVSTVYAGGEDVYNFDAAIAFRLGLINQPCYVLSNSKYLLPMIRETGSTLCWFSSNLNAEVLLAAYRDNTINFMDLDELEPSK